jgi:ribosomal protein S18 acetylase RimI-like enzyme
MEIEKHFVFHRFNNTKRQEYKCTHYANLLLLAAPAFYGLIPGTLERQISIIANLLGMPGTDLEELFVLSESSIDVALVAGLPAERLPAAKLTTALAIARQLSDDDADAFLAHLEGHEAAIESVPPNTYYLSRLAVDPLARRMGAASECMRQVMRISGFEKFSLHVHHENAAIIAVHSRLGFTFQTEVQCEYRTMTHGIH